MIVELELVIFLSKNSCFLTLNHNVYLMVNIWFNNWY